MENIDAKTNLRPILEQDVFQTLWLAISSSLSIYGHPCKGHKSTAYSCMLALHFFIHLIS